MTLLTHQTEHGTFFYRPDTSDLKAITEVVDKHGYERRDFKIEPGEHWLDLGANVGAFTVYAAMKGAQVTAFEPDPDNYELLVKNANWNGANAFLINSGIWSKAGKMPFHRNSAKGNHWRNSLLKEWKGGETIEVTLSDIKNYIEPDICLKIDIEGAEQVILDELIQTELILLVRKFALEWSFDILPSIPDFTRMVAKLAETHQLLGVTGNYLAKLTPYETWPASWFPPCAKIYGIRRD